MGYGDTDIDVLMRTELRLDDVTGKRVIRTRFGPAVTVGGVFGVGAGGHVALRHRPRWCATCRRR